MKQLFPIVQNVLTVIVWFVLILLTIAIPMLMANKKKVPLGFLIGFVLLIFNLIIAFALGAYNSNL